MATSRLSLGELESASANTGLITVHRGFQVHRAVPFPVVPPLPRPVQPKCAHPLCCCRVHSQPRRQIPNAAEPGPLQRHRYCCRSCGDAHMVGWDPRHGWACERVPFRCICGFVAAP